MIEGVVNKLQSLMSKHFDEAKPFNQLGFKAMLAWHYLVLFAPLLIAGSSPQNLLSAFPSRQITLYSAVFVTYMSLTLARKLIRVFRSSAPSPILISAAGIIGIASTLAVPFLQDLELSVGTVFLGASQAILMFSWFRYYEQVEGLQIYRSFARDMIFGAFCAFITCVMLKPFSLIILVLLPLIASSMLLASWKTTTKTTTHTEEVALKPQASASPRKKHTWRVAAVIAPATVFALTFGFIQGAYAAKGVVLLVAANSLVLFGVVLCGFVLLAIPRNDTGSANVNVIHRLAVLLLVVGIVLLPLLVGDAAIVSEVAIMLGFNLFDFGTLTLGIMITRRLHPEGEFYSGLGRAFTYLGLTLGFFVGYQLALQVDHSQITVFVLGGFAVIFVVLTILIPLNEFDQPEPQPASAAMSAAATGRSQTGEAAHSHTNLARAYASNSKEQAGNTSVLDQRQETPYKRLCGEIAVHYHLSPREREVFLLIAKGRNAEFVKNELVISTHTAKTHIANIYQKLGVHSSQEILDLVDSFKSHYEN